MQCDEQTLRRDDFRGGYEIELWDGQCWHFSRPRLAWRMSRTEGAKGVEAFLTLGRNFDEAMAGIGSAETPSELASALLNLGAAMIEINYEVDAQALHDLFVFDIDDSRNQERWLKLLRVARGLEPEDEPAPAESSTMTALAPA